MSMTGFFRASLLGALFFLCVNSAVAQDLPSIGDVTGEQIGNALQNLQLYRTGKAQLNTQISEVRGGWQKCDLTCAEAGKLDQEFGQLLFEKDYFYLVKNLSEQMSGVRGPFGLGNSGQSTLDIIDRATGGSFDGGIPKICGLKFNAWTSCIYSRLTKGGGLPTSADFNSTFAACRASYEKYQTCRDEVELAALPSQQEKLRQRREAMSKPDAFKLVMHTNTTVPKVLSNFVGTNRSYYRKQREEHPDLFEPELDNVGRDFLLNQAVVYAHDPQLDGMFDEHKKIILMCLYYNIPEEFHESGHPEGGESRTAYFWTDGAPGEFQDASWRGKLMPGNPILLIRDSVSSCPEHPPSSQAKYAFKMN